MTTILPVSRRALGALFLVVFAWFAGAPAVAWAKGSVKAEKAAVDEVEGNWKLSFIIDYGSMPDIQFVPVLITFEPVVLYERSLTDESGEKPVLTKKQLQNQKTIDVSTDISFSDGTGKMFKQTKFKITLNRSKGFEAGEYVMKIKKSDGGETIGSTVRLTLNGENKIVDRRSISFVGDSSGKKKDPPPAASADPAPSEKPAEEPTPAPSEPPPAEEPPPVPPKQGGCGCELASGPERTSASLALASLLGLFALRRRQRRA
jgi:MYXO-CTERM domain-containing protein